MQKHVALIMNAGGSSRRMGTDKALLRVPHSNMSLVEHILRRLQGLVTDRMIVVTHNQKIMQRVPHDLEVHYMEDLYAGQGPLSGMIPSLATCREWAIAIACDMPLVQATVFEKLLAFTTSTGSESGTVDAVVPVIRGKPQPLHAIYHSRCAPKFQTAVEGGQFSFRSALRLVEVRYVTEDDLRPVDLHLVSFTNINTPQEWAAYISAHT